METAVSRENYREVLSWLRGGDATPNPEMEDKFLSVIASAVQERMRRSTVPSLRNIVNSLHESGGIDCTYDEMVRDSVLPQRVSRKQEMDSAEGKSQTSSELDSVTVGLAFRHMGEMENHPLNMSQIQILMYVAYGSYLASTGNRLTAEHPQMWQFGPVFPRAYNRLRKDSSDGKAEYEAMLNERPEVAEFLRCQYQTFGFRTANIISAPHIATGSPWAKTRKKSPDKWGVTIEDSDISSWFTARMQG